MIPVLIIVENIVVDGTTSSIVGMPDTFIENITVENIEIRHPGGGNPVYAKVGPDKKKELIFSYRSEGVTIK